MVTLIARLMLIVGLIVAVPALAQDADPLSLGAAGVLIPFMNNGAGGDVSILEVTSPAGANPNLQMTFFNATCTRTVDVTLPLTTNDLALVSLNTAAPSGNGLIAIASTAVTFAGPSRLTNPIHTRMYWFNIFTGRFRVLEPITIERAGGGLTWNPLGSGATFFAPQEGGLLRTVLYLICPKTTLQGAAGAAFPSGIFPTIAPPFRSSYPVGALRARVYDDDELFIRDWQTSCDCLVEKTLSSIDTVYGSGLAAGGTYTELESDAFTDFAFTGYKALAAPLTPIDFFGRLSNNSRTDAGGSGPSTDNR